MVTRSLICGITKAQWIKVITENMTMFMFTQMFKF